MKRFISYVMVTLILFTLTACKVDKYGFDTIEDAFLLELVNMGYECTETVCSLDIFEEETTEVSTYSGTIEKTFEYRYYIDIQVFTYYELITVQTDSDVNSWNDNYIWYEIDLMAGDVEGTYLQVFYYNPDQEMLPEYRQEATSFGSIYNNTFSCDDIDIYCGILEDALEDLEKYIDKVLIVNNKHLTGILSQEGVSNAEKTWYMIQNQEFRNNDVWAGHGIHFFEEDGIMYCEYMIFGSGIPVLYRYKTEISINEDGNIIAQFPRPISRNEAVTEETDWSIIETYELVYMNNTITFGDYVYYLTDFPMHDMWY